MFYQSHRICATLGLSVFSEPCMWLLQRNNYAPLRQVQVTADPWYNGSVNVVATKVGGFMLWLYTRFVTVSYYIYSLKWSTTNNPHQQAVLCSEHYQTLVLYYYYTSHLGTIQPQGNFRVALKHIFQRGYYLPCVRNFHHLKLARLLFSILIA